MDPLEELFNLFEAELVTPKKVTPVKRKPPIAPFEDEPQGRSPDSIVKGLSGGLDRLAADMKGGSDANHPKLQDSNPMVRGPQDTKPELDPDGTPTVGTPPVEVHPEAERNERIRGDITQGLSPEDSFTAEFGREPTARDAAEIAKLQGTYTDDKLKNIPNPDNDSESVFGNEMKDQDGSTPEVSKLTANAPDFAKSSPAFITPLNNESNEQFLERSQKNLNGVGFLDVSKSLKGVDSLGIPPKYLDLISRALVSTRNKDTEKISYFAKGAGAGQISSQMGELMSMVITQLDPGNRKSFYDTIRSQILKSKEKGVKDNNMIVQQSWLDAAMNNAAAIDNYIAREFPGAKIIGGAWDNKEELNALGISPDGQPKGVSTDIVIRDSEGNNHQLSLKKSDLVNLTNGSANVYRRYMLNGIMGDQTNPKFELASKFIEGMDTFNTIYDQLGMPQIDPDYFGVPNPPPLKDIAEALGVDKNDPQVKAIVQQLKVSAENIRTAISDETLIPSEINSNKFINDMTDRLSNQFSQHRALIDKINFDVTDRSVFEDALDSTDIPDEIRKLFYTTDGKLRPKAGNLPAKMKKDELNVMAYNTALDLFNDSKDVADSIKTLDEEINLVMKSNRVSRTEALDIIEEGTRGSGSTRKLNKVKYFALLSLGGDVAKQVKQESKENEVKFTTAAIKALNTDPNMKKGMIGDLRRSFPIKDIAEGKETMVVGDTYLSKNVLKHMLGTDNWDDISERIEVKEGRNGRIYLGYVLDADVTHSGTPDVIPLADITVRQDGIGYGTAIKHEFKFAAEFGKRLRKANAELGTNVTTEDIIALFYANGSLLVEAIRHLIPQEADDETGTEPLDTVEEFDYTNDVDFLRVYGRA
jgi:hypothetical protein